MKNFLNSTFIGIVTAIIFMGLIIYSIEDDRSIFQMIFGFTVFILPFTFFSSFDSKIMSFILASVTILFGYIVYKFGYHDVWIGIVQAMLIGGAIYYYRIRTTKNFSATDYKQEAKKQRDNA
jgi:hypothetical protein